MNFSLHSACVVAFSLSVIAVPMTGISRESTLPASSGFDVREFVCPVGGEKFTQDVGYGAFELISFADGSWLGDTKIDAQIPECPGNGLVLIPNYVAMNGKPSYLTYTPEQLAKLPVLLESTEYRDLRKMGRHERAQWLATQLGMPTLTRWELLLRSSWATIDSTERKRLVARLVKEGPALIDEIDAPETQKRNARVLIVNALRELGRFDEAEAQISSLIASISPDEEIKDFNNTRDLKNYLEKLRKTIKARDDDRFPIELSPSKWVSGICAGNQMPPPYGPITKNAQAACKKQWQEDEAYSAALQEAARLRENPEKLARLCDTTTDHDRSPGLSQACEYAQQDRDAKLGDELVLHHARQVAEDCDASPEQEHRGPLRHACIEYRSTLEFALKDLLVDDDVAMQIICIDESRMPPDRATYATLACSSARNAREDRATERLLADTKSLDAKCATATENIHSALLLACLQRKRNIEREDAERLAADPAAYAAACTASDSLDGQKRLAVNAKRCDDAKRFRSRNEETERRNAQIEQCKAQGRASSVSNTGESCSELLAQERKAVRPPQINVHDSEIYKVALERAQRIVATAKAEGTYPKRKRGDLF